MQLLTLQHLQPPYPICSMYSIFTYIWVIYGVNVGKYSIHGAYGYVHKFWCFFSETFFFRSQVDVAKNQQLASQQGIRFLAPLAPLYADLMRI